MAIDATCEANLNISAYFSSDAACNELFLPATKKINIGINPPPYTFFFTGDNRTNCPQGSTASIGIKDSNGVIIDFPDYGGAFSSNPLIGVFKNTARATSNLSDVNCTCPPEYELVQCIKPCCILKSLIAEFCARVT